MSIVIPESLIATASPRRMVRPLRTLASVVLGTGLAFAGGLGATFMYDRFVATPDAVRPATSRASPSGGLAPAPVSVPEAPDPTAIANAALEHAVGQLPRTANASAVADVRNGVAFLEGRVDTPATLARLTAAVAEVEGVLAVDTRSVAITGLIHVVQRGERLSDVALRYLGDGKRWPVLAKINPDVNPDRLRPGQRLLVPLAP